MVLDLARSPDWTPDPSRPLSWARARCEHANAQGLALQARMKAWADLPDDLYVADFSEDRCAFTIRFSEEMTLPPVQAWSLQLGDVFHNLRASLDALVWAHADRDSLTPQQRKDLSFPLAMTPEAWERAKSKALRGVPKEIVERIRQDQPFVMAEPERCILLPLHQLDIQDKHREMIGTRAAATLFETNLTFHHWSTPPADGGVAYDLVTPITLEPGAVVLRGTSIIPISRIRAHLRVQIDFGFHEDLLIAESILEMLGALTQNVRAIVHHVEGTLDELAHVFPPK